MIPILYNHAEKSFTSNGLGRLTDCTSCIVTEERNGVFECEFKYPIFGRHYDEIAEGCIIFVTHDNSGVPQPFDIYKRSVPINGEVTFNAAHVSYRLGKCVVKPFTADTCSSALSGVVMSTIPRSEFLTFTDKVVAKDFEVKVPTPAKALLCGTEGSILDVYGTGEYKFDKFRVYLYLHRGRDTKVQIRYGKNLVDMTDEIDSSGSYTAVVPYWQDAETGNVKMLPERVVVAEDAPIYFDYWTDENGRRITEENGAEFDFAVANIVAATLDLTADFEEEPTEAQMRQAAQESANAHKLYTQSLTVDFVQLAQSEEYKNFAPLQELNLCDTCEVIYNNKSVRVKVVRTEYDVLADRYTQIDLGDPPANYADVIMGEVASITPTKAEMSSAIKAASDLIRGVNGGNVVFRYMNGKPYEILIMDREDVETAENVLRINMNGIGFSHNGVDGEYTTAWTLDGNFIANFIRSGVLASQDGNASWNLDTGTFKNQRPNYNVWAEINSGVYSVKAIIDGQEKRTFALNCYTDGLGNWDIGHILYLRNGYLEFREPDTNASYMKLQDWSLEINNNLTVKTKLMVGTPSTTYSETFVNYGTQRNLGQATFNGGISANQITTTSNVIVGGTLGVTGASTFTGLLTANGGVQTGTVTVSNSTANTGLVTVDGEVRTSKLLAGRTEAVTSYPETHRIIGTTRFSNSVYFGTNTNQDTSCVISTQKRSTTNENIYLAIRGWHGVLVGAAINDDITLYVTGDISCTSCAERSDETLKNIREYETAYDDVLDELEPVSFTWKEDDKKQHVGLGARRTRKILEEHGINNAGFVVVDHDDIHNINYSELSVMLLKRVQDQTKQIKDLSERLERLEALLANS